MSVIFVLPETRVKEIDELLRLGAGNKDILQKEKDTCLTLWAQHYQEALRVCRPWHYVPPWRLP